MGKVHAKQETSVQRGSKMPEMQEMLLTQLYVCQDQPKLQPSEQIQPGLCASDFVPIFWSLCQSQWLMLWTEEL
jgi:hypothetical protein